MKTRAARVFSTAALVGAVLVLAACKKKETVAAAEPAPYPTSAPAQTAAGATLERLTVARSVNADDSPGAAATSFGKGDTVYVTMWRSNIPAGAEITARWFGPDGVQITEDKLSTPGGDGYTSFHATNTKGWAPGGYRVEILLNGETAQTVTFMVG